MNEIPDYFFEALLIEFNLFKFKTTYCSSCGSAFGPGNSGYSHCKDHEFIKSINACHDSED